MTCGRLRTFVGFGFGAIQGGLFLYEAFRSGNFGRLVVAEVMADVVDAVRQARGFYSVNIAHPDGIEAVQVGPVEILLPQSEADRRRLIAATAEAEEIATAVPSVQYYISRGAKSLHRILAAGFQMKLDKGGPRAIVYAAENHNHAAEILEEAVLSALQDRHRTEVCSRIRFLNTVIGKMSGVVSDPAGIRERGLAAIAPGVSRAFLVEEFNRILISRIRFGEGTQEQVFSRGISTFEEKDDLIPFEEAKLYGHNAIHALAAYLGLVRGLRRIVDLRAYPDIVAFLRTASIEESGEALIRKHSGVDRLFTPAGYQEYADDLFERMLNPHLQDTVERVGRDPERKLGWEDRLIGTMRLALSQGVQPRRYAVGAAAALAVLSPQILETGTPVADLCDAIWRPSSPARREREEVLLLIEEGRHVLKRWRQSGFTALPASM
ncbi:MAG: hypothetical protein HXY20_08515 [Acidobacteria bacterium]|nr:hypothetical protein [Acidobacteriota bacterium]